MTDQARALRNRAAPMVFEPARQEVTGGALVVGSGKGGVGKSLVAVTMASTLAASGKKVLLVDADFNLGTLHVLLGIRPAVQPENLLDPGTSTASAVVPVCRNLWLLPSASGSEALQRLGPHERVQLHRRATQLFPDYDAVVIDCAAGLDVALRVTAMQASRLVLVTTPEPAALTSAYALIKLVHGRLPRLPIDLLVNRVAHQDEGSAAAERIGEACNRFLGREVRYLGGVPEDPGMRSALSRPEELVVAARLLGHAGI
ncbi:MAG TPA: AAA family ATPase, partial [Gemmatimonadales bacterium]|nr:AAA family ATPase [Gemmatimonadales bacterium]